MRKSKARKPPVKQHTPAERLAMRRHKRKHGPSGLRRAQRRAHLQPKPEPVSVEEVNKEEAC